MKLWNTEPVALIATISAIISTAIGFGLKVSPEQLALINVALTAVAAVSQRSKVSPVALSA